jgi:hypothetical protein
LSEAPCPLCEPDPERVEGEKPITVLWKLRDPVPDRWFSQLGSEVEGREHAVCLDRIYFTWLRL